mmetsp:Transcript_32010/g.58957  ORF Transcript_32010/g.58957 Transcript_32010/m.58957 type:complete len:442 (-) Transcript_32010:94-1419(-)|eukprot:CAMPEP_0197453770 /NCGR_PEP_ID=MMETSP1175-20131217/35940_1 /TAXON_ID=1003142 /ORGANISM="Triceratium dubium, Strain CCMP147" /LENGTH=441 /DNA_ID=CAMNT_0042987157 /DNA_START=126 /DNA_END=1451 /DNA_ORIENTATION=+
MIERERNSAASEGDQQQENSLPAGPQPLSESADAASSQAGGRRERTLASKTLTSRKSSKNSMEKSRSSPVNERFDNEDDDNRGSHSEDGASSLPGAAAEAEDPSFVTPFRKMNNARIACGRFVNDDRVQLVVVALITINAIMMGIATFDFVTDDPAIEAAFEMADLVFLIVFTVELGLQFIYHGFRLFLDGWLLFDTVIIFLSWAFSEVQIIRAFRIFRALRLVTRVAVMRNLVKALFAVMPNLAAITMLLSLVMYIFSVMFTTLFKYSYKEGLTTYDYFSRLDRTFFTLFQITTFDKWADPARGLMPVYNWSWVLFIVFVIVAGFIFVNLIVAVICDAIATLHDDEKALLRGQGGIIDDDYDSEEDESLTEEERQQRSSARQLMRQDGLGTQHRRKATSVQQQIKTLELQIEKTKELQRQTEMTIEHLTRHLQSLPSPDR